MNEEQREVAERLIVRLDTAPAPLRDPDLNDEAAALLRELLAEPVINHKMTTEPAERLAELVALLWQLRHALALASAICDAVPNRDPGHLGVLVNAQPDGTHGYRLIQDAEAALVEYLTTPTSAEPQGEPVAWHVCSVNSDGSLSLEFAAPWEELAHEHINDAINEHDIDGAASWVVRPVYASPQPQQTEPSQNTHPPQQLKPLTRSMQAEIECGCLVAWNASTYGHSKQDTVHPMFLSAFILGYWAAERAHGITGEPT